MSSTDRYLQRGVSADKSEVHEAIKGLDKGLFPNAFCKILPDYVASDENYCTIMHADTAGTKTSLAYMYWKETGDLSVWEGIVQDALVMNLDDMACSGCIDNIIVSSTIGRNKNLVTGDVIKTIILGAQRFFEDMQALGVNMHSAGGETADVGDIVRTADVGFTAFGRLKKSDVIDIDIQAGDLVVGVASYGQASYENAYNGGMGSNGLTSARHDVFSSEYRQKYPETYDPATPQHLVYSGSRSLTEKIMVDGQEINLGKLVLSPTRTFLPILSKVIKSHKSSISGIIHNTGGAHSKVKKFLHPGTTVIKDQLLSVPPLFEIIRTESGASLSEMFQVFNMGTRLEFYVRDKAVADEIIGICQGFNIEAGVIGHVTTNNTQEQRVEVHYQGGIYNY